MRKDHPQPKPLATVASREKPANDTFPPSRYFGAKELIGFIRVWDEVKGKQPSPPSSAEQKEPLR